MFCRGVSVLTTLLIGVSQLAFAFTVINQTDAEKVMEIESAYRSESGKPGVVGGLLDTAQASYKFTIPGKSIYTFTLTDACPEIIVSVMTVTPTATGSSTSTFKSYYGPYEYHGEDDKLLTDDWGLVISNPNPTPIRYLEGGIDRNAFRRESMRKIDVVRGCSIKCLHPGLLEKVTSMDVLPEELQN